MDNKLNYDELLQPDGELQTREDGWITFFKKYNNDTVDENAVLVRNIMDLVVADSSDESSNESVASVDFECAVSPTETIDERFNIAEVTKNVKNACEKRLQMWLANGFKENQLMLTSPDYNPSNSWLLESLLPTRTVATSFHSSSMSKTMTKEHKISSSTSNRHKDSMLKQQCREMHMETITTIVKRKVLVQSSHASSSACILSSGGSGNTINANDLSDDVFTPTRIPSNVQRYKPNDMRSQHNSTCHSYTSDSSSNNDSIRNMLCVQFDKTFLRNSSANKKLYRKTPYRPLPRKSCLKNTTALKTTLNLIQPHARTYVHRSRPNVNHADSDASATDAQHRLQSKKRRNAAPGKPHLDLDRDVGSHLPEVHSKWSGSKSQTSRIMRKAKSHHRSPHSSGSGVENEMCAMLHSMTTHNRNDNGHMIKVNTDVNHKSNDKPNLNIQEFRTVDARDRNEKKMRSKSKERKVLYEDRVIEENNSELKKQKQISGSVKEKSSQKDRVLKCEDGEELRKKYDATRTATSSEVSTQKQVAITAEEKRYRKDDKNRTRSERDEESSSEKCSNSDEVENRLKRYVYDQENDNLRQNESSLVKRNISNEKRSKDKPKCENSKQYAKILCEKELNIDLSGLSIQQHPLSSNSRTKSTRCNVDDLPNKDQSNGKLEVEISGKGDNGRSSKKNVENKNQNNKLNECVDRIDKKPTSATIAPNKEEFSKPLSRTKKSKDKKKANKNNCITKSGDTKLEDKCKNQYVLEHISKDTNLPSSDNKELFPKPSENLRKPKLRTLSTNSEDSDSTKPNLPLEKIRNIPIIVKDSIQNELIKPAKTHDSDKIATKKPYVSISLLDSSDDEPDKCGRNAAKTGKSKSSNSSQSSFERRVTTKIGQKWRDADNKITMNPEKAVHSSEDSDDMLDGYKIKSKTRSKSKLPNSGQPSQERAFITRTLCTKKADVPVRLLSSPGDELGRYGKTSKSKSKESLERSAGSDSMKQKNKSDKYPQPPVFSPKRQLDVKRTESSHKSTEPDEFCSPQKRRRQFNQPTTDSNAHPKSQTSPQPRRKSQIVMPPPPPLKPTKIIKQTTKKPSSSTKVNQNVGCVRREDRPSQTPLPPLNLIAAISAFDENNTLTAIPTHHDFQLQLHSTASANQDQTSLKLTNLTSTSVSYSTLEFSPTKNSTARYNNNKITNSGNIAYPQLAARPPTRLQAFGDSSDDSDNDIDILDRVRGHQVIKKPLL